MSTSSGGGDMGSWLAGGVGGTLTLWRVCFWSGTFAPRDLLLDLCPSRGMKEGLVLVLAALLVMVLVEVARGTFSFVRAIKHSEVDAVWSMAAIQPTLKTIVGVDTLRGTCKTLITPLRSSPITLRSSGKRKTDGNRNTTHDFYPGEDNHSGRVPPALWDSHPSIFRRHPSCSVPPSGKRLDHV